MIVGKHHSYQEAKDSAQRMADFYSEPYRVVREGMLFLVECRWSDRIALHTCYPTPDYHADRFFQAEALYNE